MIKLKDLISEDVDIEPFPQITYDPIDPPAIHQQADQFRVTPELIKFIKYSENAGKEGFENGKWLPHKSYEGGSPTIAYGHKLKRGEDFSNGISEREALNLLHQDIKTAWKLADSQLKSKYGSGMNALPLIKQEIFVDYAFNLGTLIKGGSKGFPKFVQAVIDNDKAGINKEYIRKANGKPLTRRNTLMKGVYLDKL